MAVATYTKSGAKATTAASLDKVVFGLNPTNHQLLKDAYVAYLANGRSNSAVTKTRGLVRGGGRKPWRQKGLGRARAGSNRSPIWRGGGITFGPSGQVNYKKRLNVKAKRLALRQALSLASKDGQLIVIEDVPEKLAKTAQLASFLNKIGATGLVALVVEAKTPELILVSRNLVGVNLINQAYLSVYDLLNADQVVITKPALALIIKRLKDQGGGDV